MVPMGCRVLIHAPEKLRSSGGFHAVPGYYVGPALNHYRCFIVFPIKTISIIHSDTVEFRHNFITVPVVMTGVKVVSAITQLKQELAAMPSPSSIHQLTAIKQLPSLFYKHKDKKRLPTTMMMQMMPSTAQSTINLHISTTIKKNQLIL